MPGPDGHAGDGRALRVCDRAGDRARAARKGRDGRGGLRRVVLRRLLRGDAREVAEVEVVRRVRLPIGADAAQREGVERLRDRLDLFVRFVNRVVTPAVFERDAVGEPRLLREGRVNAVAPAVGQLFVLDARPPESLAQRGFRLREVAHPAQARGEDRINRRARLGEVVGE